MSSSAGRASRLTSFNAFYPFYQSQHKKLATRALHVVGTCASNAILVAAMFNRVPKLLPLALVAGYGFAWVGHFFCEKNRPATFKYPLWSLIADQIMTVNILLGREAWVIKDQATAAVTH